MKKLLIAFATLLILFLIPNTYAEEVKFGTFFTNVKFNKTYKTHVGVIAEIETKNQLLSIELAPDYQNIKGLIYWTFNKELNFSIYSGIDLKLIKQNNPKIFLLASVPVGASISKTFSENKKLYIFGQYEIPFMSEYIHGDTLTAKYGLCVGAKVVIKKMVVQIEHRNFYLSHQTIKETKISFGIKF